MAPRSSASTSPPAPSAEALSTPPGGRLLERAAGLGIPLTVENGPDPVKNDVNLLAALLGRFESPWLRLTFGTGNRLYAGIAPEEALTALSRYVGCVHLKDIIAGGDGLKHSHAGSGVVDVRGLARRVVAGGYASPLILEFPGGDDPRGRVIGSLAYLAAEPLDGRVPLPV